MSKPPGPPRPGAARTLPPRVRLVVLFGGRSAEHDISCVSATHVMAAIDQQRYEVVPVGITREGRFVAAAGTLQTPGTVQTPDTPAELTAAGPEVDLGESLVADGDVPTVVMPILHGPNGEDGTIQGLLEIADVPYVGAGVLASALSMDKDMAKTVLGALGVPQTPWRTMRAHSPADDPALASMLEDLGPFVFVKPANMGSSIGVSRVESSGGPKALRDALDGAFRYDDIVLVEAGVEGRELECAVLGNEDPQASVLGEVVTDADFYDFTDKYVDGTARTVIPAQLDDATMEAGRRLAVHTYEALRCRGMARVDMFLSDDGQLLVNEVNTIPGFTPISMYPKLWEASGLSYGALLDELVALALAEHRRRHALSSAGLTGPPAESSS